MKIAKCDICKKNIDPDEEKLSLAYSNAKIFNSFDFCSACSQSILDILKEQKIIKD